MFFLYKSYVFFNSKKVHDKKTAKYKKRQVDNAHYEMGKN